jgi:hypothetical protein
VASRCHPGRWTWRFTPIRNMARRSGVFEPGVLWELKGSGGYAKCKCVNGPPSVSRQGIRRDPRPVWEIVNPEVRVSCGSRECDDSHSLDAHTG